MFTWCVQLAVLNAEDARMIDNCNRLEVEILKTYRQVDSLQMKSIELERINENMTEVHLRQLGNKDQRIEKLTASVIEKEDKVNNLQGRLKRSNRVKIVFIVTTILESIILYNVFTI